MDHERFDQLAKTVFGRASRRRILGGALASLAGVGTAAASGLAKGKRHGGRGQGRDGGSHKHGRGKGKGKKADAEFVCTAGNALGACGPFACCETTPAGNGPACVGVDLQAGTRTCGNPALAGAGVCRTCPAGTRCSGFPLFQCVCDSVSCADGCCIPQGFVGNDDDICVKNGSGELVNTDDPFFNGVFVCGTRGGICNVCSVGALFSGCCTAGGACAAGTSNTNCGSDGKLCETCQNDSSCGDDQACTGGTTTTTTTTTTACAGTVCANGTCCPLGQVCTGDGGCKTKKRRKK